MDIILAIIGSGVLSTLVSGLFALTQQRRQAKAEAAKTESAADAAIKAGLMVLLEDRINSICSKHIREGSICLEDKERLMRMWAVYHNCLGGNGYLDAKMEMLEKLKVELD